jgi:tetratricopeptide (TPR) repeat protein
MASLRNARAAPTIASARPTVDCTISRSCSLIVIPIRTFFCVADFTNAAIAPLAIPSGFFERALAIDPRNVEALVGTAQVDASMGASVLTEDRIMYLTRAERTLDEVLFMAPQHAFAHAVMGLVQIATNRAAQGIAECERALALDRNLAHAHGFIGLAKIYIGRATETEGHIREALRLSPRDTRAYLWMMFVGAANLQLRADAEALAWCRRGLEVNRNHSLSHFQHAAALALIGHMNEAGAAKQAGLALDPSFTLRRFRVNVPSDNPTYRAGARRIYEAMRLAGVPEGPGCLRGDVSFGPIALS